MEEVNFAEFVKWLVTLPPGSPPSEGLPFPFVN